MIRLPWPDKRLSPNARTHWRAFAPVKKQARADGAKATFEAFQGGAREARFAFCGDHPIPITVTFYPPCNRKRDRDNLIASLKHAMDGIADALAVNDHRFIAQYVVGEKHGPNGCVTVEFP